MAEGQLYEVVEPTAPLRHAPSPDAPLDTEALKGERVTVPFDMLHVSPPQSPAEEIKSSPLANAAGWVEVNQNTMQHVRYPNVFSLGDVAAAAGLSAFVSVVPPSADAASDFPLDFAAAAARESVL